MVTPKNDLKLTVLFRADTETNGLKGFSNAKLQANQLNCHEEKFDK